METENKYKGKFAIGIDMICGGETSVKDENNIPVLYDSYNDAFKEIFDDAHSMLSNQTEEELAEYNEDVTEEMIAEMGRLLTNGDVEAMKVFLAENSQCNYNEEFVSNADEFIEGRKAIFIGGK